MLLRCLALLSLFLAGRAAQAGPITEVGIPWPQEHSDLPASPRVTFGRLENGLRYAVLPNRTPAGAVSLRLLVLAGSLNETTGELGYAHFVEHMAFSGTTAFPAGELIKFLQRLGVSFGPDINAETTETHTIYKLDLPENSDATVEASLRILRDFAGGILFDPVQVNRQRGVILNERLSRQSPAQAEYLARTNFIFAGTLIGKRPPIGTEKSVSDARREGLRAFYDAWYRPERMVVVVSGDIVAAKVVARLEEDFATLRARALERAEPAISSPLASQELAEQTFPEMRSGVQIEIGAVRGLSRLPDSLARHQQRLLLHVAGEMLHQRLLLREEQPNRPIADASVHFQEQFGRFDELRLMATGTTAGWKAVLATAEQELRRALELGFDPTELVPLQESLANAAEAAAKAAATAGTSDLADALVDDTERESVFWLPDELLATILRSIDQLTVADCRRALRAAWEESGHYLFVSVPSGSTLSAAAVKTAYADSRAVPVLPLAALKKVIYASNKLAPPGVVLQREHVADLDLWLVRFANGVTLDFKHTEFERGAARISIRLGSGSLEEPPDKPGLRVWTGGLLYAIGGLGRYSPGEAQRAFTGLTAHIDCRCEDDAFVFQVNSSSADFPALLNLLVAHLTDPGFRPEGNENMKTFLGGMYQPLEQSSDGATAVLVTPFLGGSDPRLGLPKRDVAFRYSMADLKAWIQPTLQSGAIEVAVVGDVDLERVVADVEKTFGALPPRTPKPDLAAKRRLRFPAPPARHYYTYSGTSGRTTLAYYWPVHAAISKAENRRLGLLSIILGDRLRVQIRDDLGAAYSPTANFDYFNVFPGFAAIHCQLEVKSAQDRKISDLVGSLVSNLARDGVTVDELQRAQAQMTATARQWQHSNDYWLIGVLADAQERPSRLVDARTAEGDYGNATKSEIDSLAAAYLKKNNLFTFVIRAQRPAAPKF